MGAITGPIEGGVHGWPFGCYLGDIGRRGYLEQEFFLMGAAKRYRPVGAHGTDGKWTVKVAGDAPFNTRILVKRPKDPRQV